MSRRSDPREEDLQRIARAPGVRVVDETLGRAMLLEGPDDAIEELQAQLSDWTVAREMTYPAPGPAVPPPGDDG